jgi:hypothetical protein
MLLEKAPLEREGLRDEQTAKVAGSTKCERSLSCPQIEPKATATVENRGESQLGLAASRAVREKITKEQRLCHDQEKF